MDCFTEQQKQQAEDEVMEVPEIDGDLLAEFLDAPHADAGEEPDEATSPQLGFTADVVVDGWAESHELMNSIHPHHDCEDCGLDGGVLADFELEGCGCSRSRSSPFIAFDDDATQWTETAEFIGDCMGEWYMDGMGMEWEEEEGEGNDISFGPFYVGDVGTEEGYSSPLWE